MLTRLAQTPEDHSALLNAVRGRAMILLFMGHVVEAQEEVERAITAFELSDENVRLMLGQLGKMLERPLSHSYPGAVGF